MSLLDFLSISVFDFLLPNILNDPNTERLLLEPELAITIAMEGSCRFYRWWCEQVPAANRWCNCMYDCECASHFHSEGQC